MMYYPTLWCRMWKMELNWLGLGFNFRNMPQLVVFCTRGSMNEHGSEDECVGDQGVQVEYWTWDYWCSNLCVVALARIILCPWTLVSVLKVLRSLGLSNGVALEMYIVNLECVQSILLTRIVFKRWWGWSVEWRRISGPIFRFFIAISSEWPFLAVECCNITLKL